MPKLENLDLVDQLGKKELGESMHQSEDDLRVESGGPLRAREMRGEIPPTKGLRFKKNIGNKSDTKVAEPEDAPSVSVDIETGREISNPEEIIHEGIDKRHLKRSARKRYYSVGGRKRIQQKQNRVNRKIRSGGISAPTRSWHDPSIAEGNPDARLKRVALDQDNRKLDVDPKWPTVKRGK